MVCEAVEGLGSVLVDEESHDTDETVARSEK